MSSRWQPTTAKVQLKLCIQRLRMLSSKKEAQLKAQRREIASLVEKAKLETARVVRLRFVGRAEPPARRDDHQRGDPHRALGDPRAVLRGARISIGATDRQLLSARFGLVETSRDLEPSVSEAVYGLVHASQKTELVRLADSIELTSQRELHQLREMLLNHYGRGMVEEAAENAADRVTGKLAVRTPARELVDAYLCLRAAYRADNPATRSAAHTACPLSGQRRSAGLRARYLRRCPARATRLATCLRHPKRRRPRPRRIAPSSSTPAARRRSCRHPVRLPHRSSRPHRRRLNSRRPSLMCVRWHDRTDASRPCNED